MPRTPQQAHDVRVRFAPSPTGRLHLGHAYSAFLNAHVASRAGTQMILRIEDIDRIRALPQHVDGIVEDLTWLGLDWQQPVMHQSQRFGAYRTATDTLQALGLLYPCFATRSDLLAAAAFQPADPQAQHTDPDGAPLYPGLWRNADPSAIAARIEAGVPYALRLDMKAAIALDRENAGGQPLAFEELGVGGLDDEEREITSLEMLADRASAREGSGRMIASDAARWGDVVIVRKDTPTSYHLAVVTDDAAQRISTVIRGMDLFAATDIQRLLQRLLGLPAPRYCHHPLIRAEDGAKLSKSLGAPTIAAARAAGLTPQVIRQQLFGRSNVASAPRFGS